MTLNYTFCHTGSSNKVVNYYITHLLYEVVSDNDSEPVDIALRATCWEWDRWFYVPDNLLTMMNEPELEKLRGEIARSLMHVVDVYAELFDYLRSLAQDRIAMDYIDFVPRRYGVLIYYPHDVELGSVV